MLHHQYRQVGTDTYSPTTTVSVDVTATADVAKARMRVRESLSALVLLLVFMPRKGEVWSVTHSHVVLVYTYPLQAIL